jgi:hypothetical protein
MKIGSYSQEVYPPVIVNIECDTEFKVYGVDESGEISHFFGPYNTQLRKWRFELRENVTAIQVTTDDWALSTLALKKIPPSSEIFDPRPMSVAMRQSAPPTLKDEMRRFFRQEMATYALSQGKETEEEANDFELPEDDQDPLSGYEVIDMVNEAPVEQEEPEGEPPEGEDPQLEEPIKDTS